jgi:hypothetical protein
MEAIPLKPERMLQLAEYARRHKQDTVTALDDVLAAALDWEREDYREAVDGVGRGYADYLAGRTQPADEMFEELRVKHGIPR